MAQFKVFQFELSNEDEALINSKGWDASPKIKAYADSRFGKFTPASIPFYGEVCEIEADTLDQVFDIGNIGPEEYITRKAPMHSVSVGDIIIDPVGDMHLVAPMGFTKL
jgi:hypothetical protein